VGLGIPPASRAKRAANRQGRGLACAMSGLIREECGLEDGADLDLNPVQIRLHVGVS